MFDRTDRGEHCTPDMQPEAEVAELCDDLCCELRSVLAMVRNATHYCPTLLAARAVINDVVSPPLNPERRSRDFSLFDFLDVVEEIECSIEQLQKFRETNERANSYINALDEVPELLRDGLKEFCNLTLKDWAMKRPIHLFGQGRGWLSNNPHENTKVLHYCMFPALEFDSLVVKDFLDHLGLRTSGGEIPAEIEAALEPAEFVAHLVTSSMNRQCYSLRTIGSSIRVPLPPGLLPLQPQDAIAIQGYWKSQVRTPFFSNYLLRQKAEFTYNLVDQSTSPAIEVAVVPRIK